MQQLQTDKPDRLEDGDTDEYDLYVQLRKLKNKDDRVRWGTATRTRASNMKGHEFRSAYGVMKDMRVVARLRLMKQIESRVFL